MDLLLYDTLFEILSDYPSLAIFLPSYWVLEDDDTPPSLEIKWGTFFGKVGRKWLRGRSRKMIKTSLCHLAAHILCGHHRRWFYMYNTDRWNVACDYEANHLLRQIDLAEFMSLRPSKREWIGKSAEEIYLLLPENSNQRKSGLDEHRWMRRDGGDIQMEDIIKNSFGFQHLNKRGDISKILDDISSLAKGMISPNELVMKILAGDNKSSKNKRAGDATVSEVSVVSPDGSHKPPFKLIHFLVATIGKKRGFLPPELDFLLLWRHQFADIFLPFSPRSFLVCVDTSSSMSEEALSAVASFVVGFHWHMKMMHPYCNFVVVMADVMLQKEWKSYNCDGDLLEFMTEMQGRGGTKIFTALREHLGRQPEEPDAILIISDFETQDDDTVIRDKYNMPIFGMIVVERNTTNLGEIMERLQKRFRTVKFVGGLPVG